MKLMIGVPEGSGLSENAGVIDQKIREITGKNIIFLGPQLPTPSFTITIVDGDETDIKKIKNEGYEVAIQQ